MWPRSPCSSTGEGSVLKEPVLGDMMLTLKEVPREWLGPCFGCTRDDGGPMAGWSILPRLEYGLCESAGSGRALSAEAVLECRDWRIRDTGFLSGLRSLESLLSDGPRVDQKP